MFKERRNPKWYFFKKKKIRIMDKRLPKVTDRMARMIAIWKKINNHYILVSLQRVLQCWNPTL